MSELYSQHDVYLHELLRRVDMTNNQVRELTRELSDEQLAWRPTDGGWSIGQVLEHLVVTGTVYNEHLRPVLVRALFAGKSPTRSPWAPSLAGRLLAGASSSSRTRRLRTPRILRIGPTVRPDVVREFLRCQEELAGLMKHSHGLDLTWVRTHSPVSRLLRINLGDCFTIVVLHAQHHLQQMKRIRAHPEFPVARAAVMSKNHAA